MILTASGLLAALAVATVQGVLVTLLPATAFRRVSTWMQTILMGGLVMLLLLSPQLASLLAGLVKGKSKWAYAFPGYWFAGLYEHVRPAVANSFLLHLGAVALWALAGVSVLFVLTYLPGYRRHTRKVLEARQPQLRGLPQWKRDIGALIDARLLKQPVQIAVFHFINQTITRSMKHRLFLATYAGCGAALAVLTFGSDHAGLLRLPLTLSFILISALRAAFNFPSELAANWAFQASESNHLRDSLAAMRKWILICAIGPLSLLQAPLEFGNFSFVTALSHLAFGIGLSALLVEIMFLGFRKVPFTCAYFPGKTNLVALSVIYVFGFTMYSSLMASLEARLETEPPALAAFFATLALAYGLLTRWHDRQLAPDSGLDYEDADDPAVRTLELGC